MQIFMLFLDIKCLGQRELEFYMVKRHYLEKIPPFMGGGDMIRQVHPQDISYPMKSLTNLKQAHLPIAEVVGLSSAIDYLEKIGMRNIQQHEHSLMRYAFDRLSKMPGYNNNWKRA